MLKSKIQDKIRIVEQKLTTVSINRQARSTIKIDLQEVLNQ